MDSRQIVESFTRLAEQVEQVASQQAAIEKALKSWRRGESKTGEPTRSMRSTSPSEVIRLAAEEGVRRGAGELPFWVSQNYPDQFVGY